MIKYKRMSKFLSALLKIIMVVSFVGIMVFVTVAIINSRDVAFEAYNYVSTNKENLEIEALVSDIDDNVKLGPGILNNEYTSFIGSAVLETSRGIDYFLDYLSSDGDITRGEQDKIIKSFDSVSVEVTNVRNLYNNYLLEYKAAEEQGWGEFATARVKGSEEELVEKYVLLFNTEYTLLKNIVEVLQENFDLVLSYNSQTYLLKSGLASGGILEVFQNGYKQYSPDDSESRLEISSCQKVDDYYDYLRTCTQFSNKDVMLNDTLRQFVDDLNQLNIYSFVSNFEGYVENLYGTLRVRAENAKAFFDSYFLV